MKQFFVFFSSILIIFLTSCSESHKESGFRVFDEETYKPSIDEGRLYDSLDELEKLITAPFYYFRDKNGIYSFSQSMSYSTLSADEEGNKRELRTNESSKYESDKSGNFAMSYKNDKNEGWDIVWKDNFLYRKQFGGEFTKTFSMGEHKMLRDNSFNAIPSIYLMLRDHASIASSKAEGDGHTVTIVFGDKKTERSALHQKKYLQNLQGTEEKHNDDLIKGFNDKKKEDIKGKMTVHISSEGAVTEMKIEELSFRFAEEGVTFDIKGARKLSAASAEISEPEYNEEYHRRTLDSSVNIMKKKSEKKEEKHDEE